MSERANHLTAATIMLGKAQEALLHSYSPYSKFPVAAVVEDEHGTLFTGVNIENASFGLTICAERAAVFAAVSAGARGIRAVAISAILTQVSESNPWTSIGQKLWNSLV